ncbi:MAG: OmpA family protein [Archangium sp.]
MLLSLALISSVVVAQTPSADIEQVWIDPAGRGSLTVGNGSTLPQTGYRVGVSAFYTYGNLRSLNGTSSNLVLSDRLGFQVFGALGLTNWLEVSTHASVFALQQGSTSLGVSTAGLGNPWLHGKVNLLDGQTKPVSLAVDLGLALPVGTNAAQGNGGFAFAPKVQVGKVFDAFQLGAELGFLFRPITDYLSVTGVSTDLLGSQMWVAGMITSVNHDGPRGEAMIRVNAPLTGTGRPGIEGLFGVRWPAGPVELYAVAGPGVFGEPATASVRAYFGAAFSNEPMTRPPCVEGQPYELKACPDLDRDGDGVKNGVDGAPLVAEDKDGFQDEDGVLDADNDGDSVLDADDLCRDVRGLPENKGCPDTDSDGDGVVDRLDRCKDQKEDLDDYEDGDGCPEPDNDRDGFLDGADACPNIVGIVQERGCPAKDSDNDQVFDHEDNCPSEPGSKDNAGCPEKNKQLVIITSTSLKILDRVYFDNGKATIQKRSNPLLDNVASVLVSHAEIVLLQVEGHTDDVGKPETNKKLSQDRANAVKDYLVKKGVQESRLRAVGFGSEKPAVANDTPANREQNRRVEFNLITQ